MKIMELLGFHGIIMKQIKKINNPHQNNENHEIPSVPFQN